MWVGEGEKWVTMKHTVTHYNTLQHTATHCDMLQHIATHCNALQHSTTHCHTLRHAATHCNTLQRTATHCNTLPHTATHWRGVWDNETHCHTLRHTTTHCSSLQHQERPLRYTRCCRGIECLIYIGHFMQKSPIISGSFAKNDLQLKASCASSQPCTRGRVDACVLLEI